MKSLIYKAFSLGVAFLALTSCDDFLDQNPDERVEIDTEDKVVQLLTGGYNSSNWGYLCEMSSDNIIDNNSPHLPANPNAEQVTVYYNLAPYERMDNEVFAFEQVTSSTSTDSPTMVWSGCYQSIAVANHALQAIDQIVANNNGVMSEKLRAARGEALLLRAYNHFLLVNIFSQAYKDDVASKEDVGVPYMTTVENTVSPDYDRGNVADVYAKIEQDLEAGLEDISDINYQMPKWHFNVNAAHAFAARFYLFKRDYDKVIEHADAVLGQGTANLPTMLMDYSLFEGCTSQNDYANVWQDPEANNNLMLIPTYSTMWRALVGNRYAMSGPALQDVYYRAAGPNYNVYPVPCINRSGMFYAGDQDYGFISAKLAETFQYTDLVAGIGYAHIVRREFTASALLLERAEAKILSQNRDIAGAVEDMIAYDNSRQTFEGAEGMMNTGSIVPLTEEDLVRYYSNVNNPNCYADWNFTQNMSSNFVIPQEVVPYMNAINDLRRFETAFDGLRFFDLKRFGIEYSHSIGNPAQVITLAWNDPRRALEVPLEVMAAGMESSRPLDNSKLKNGVPFVVVNKNNK